jgi:hypothetical protein
VLIIAFTLYLHFTAEGGHYEADEQEANASSQEDHRKQAGTGAVSMHIYPLTEAHMVWEIGPHVIILFLLLSNN